MQSLCLGSKYPVMRVDRWLYGIVGHPEKVPCGVMLCGDRVAENVGLSISGDSPQLRWMIIVKSCPLNSPARYLHRGLEKLLSRAGSCSVFSICYCRCLSNIVCSLEPERRTRKRFLDAVLGGDDEADSGRGVDRDRLVELPGIATSGFPAGS